MPDVSVTGTAPTAVDHLCGAEMLEGMELPNGWKVIAKVPRGSTATGGNFSVPYYVKRVEDGQTREAFLKALNFRALASSSDFLKDVQLHTAAFNFEKETLELCRDKKLRRIAMVLDAGEYRFSKGSLPVCYIIFELAPSGDARKMLATLHKLDLAWTLRTLHQVAIALRQLHGEGIAHQDVKPSIAHGLFQSLMISCSDPGLQPDPTGAHELGSYNPVFTR